MKFSPSDPTGQAEKFKLPENQAIGNPLQFNPSDILGKAADLKLT